MSASEDVDMGDAIDPAVATDDEAISSPPPSERIPQIQALLEDQVLSKYLKVTSASCEFLFESGNDEGSEFRMASLDALRSTLEVCLKEAKRFDRGSLSDWSRSLIMPADPSSRYTVKDKHDLGALLTAWIKENETFDFIGMFAHALQHGIARLDLSATSEASDDENARRTDLFRDFGRPFMGKGLQNLVAHLDHQQKNFDYGKHYARQLGLVQSSGVGKSRLSIELSKVHVGLVVCIRPPDGEARSSLPPRDDGVASFLCPPRTSVKPRNYEEIGRDLVNLAAWLAAFASKLTRLMERFQKGLPGDGPEADGGTDLIMWLHRQLNAPLIQPPGEAIGAESPARSYTGPRTSRPTASTDPVLSARQGSSPEPIEASPVRTGGDAEATTSRHDFLSAILEAATKMREELSVAFGSEFKNKKLVPAPESNDPKGLHKAHVDATEFIAKQIQLHFRKLERIHRSIVRPPPEAGRSSGELGQADGPRMRCIFLAIDEASHLGYRLYMLRRLWRELAPDSCWLLWTDTNTTVSKFAGDEAIRASQRIFSSGNLLIKPFTMFPFNLDLRDQLQKRRPNKDSQLLFSQMEELWRYIGRPLWKGHQLRHGPGLQIGGVELSQVGRKLLMQQEHAWPVDEAPDNKVLAVTSQRLPLDFIGVQGLMQDTSLEQDQVAHHLRYLGDVQVDGGGLRTVTPSEPLVSCAAADLFRKDPAKHWSQAIKTIRKAAKASGLMLGEQGEAGVRLLLSAAADLAAASQGKSMRWDDAKYERADLGKWRLRTHLEPVCVLDWLRELFGEQSLSNATKDWARQQYINFTHFTKLNRQCTVAHPLPRAVLEESFMQQLALVGIINQVAWDMLIPTYHSEQRPTLDDAFDPDKLSMIAVQVKNRDDATSQSEWSGMKLPELEQSTDRLAHLRIFFDLRATRAEGVIDSDREPEAVHDAQGQPGERYPLRGKKRARSRKGIIYASGYKETTFPLLKKLSTPARNSLPALLGFLSSEDEKIRWDLRDPDTYQMSKGNGVFGATED